MATSTPASPLRYPGGKQCLAPFVRALIEDNDMKGCIYAEPYAGGAGVALRLLMDGIVSRVILNDKCTMLVAFWRSLFWSTDKLLRMVEDTPVTIETWHNTRVITQFPTKFSDEEVAFALFFQNRTNFSGVIDGGVIGGKNQTGKYKLDARYPKARLISLMERVSSFRDNVDVYNLDAITFMKSELLPLGNSCLTYCDPPYYEKGQALYLNAYLPQDHALVADFLQSYSATMSWMVSYDNAPEIVQIYHKSKLFSFDLPYSVRRVRKGKELLALCDSLKIPSSRKLQLQPVT